MFNRIFRTATSKTQLPAQPDERPADDTADNTASASSPQAHRQSTLKTRLLENLGFAPDSQQARPAAPRFTQHESAVLPSTPASRAQVASAAAAATRELHALGQTIRAHLRTLPAAEAERYRRFLDNSISFGDPARQIFLLKILEAHVSNTVLMRSAAAAQPSALKSLAQTTVTVQFQGVFAEMSGSKEEEVLLLRADILKLPHTLATRYQTLLRDVLESGDSGKRDALLSRMAKQVRARVEKDGHTHIMQFQGVVAEMSSSTEGAVLQLRADILKLPSGLATCYQTLLRDILESDDLGKRDALLSRMAKQVRARVEKDRHPRTVR